MRKQQVVALKMYVLWCRVHNRTHRENCRWTFTGCYCRKCLALLVLNNYIGKRTKSITTQPIYTALPGTALLQKIKYRVSLTYSWVGFQETICTSNYLEVKQTYMSCTVLHMANTLTEHSLPPITITHGPQVTISSAFSDVHTYF